MFSCMNSSIMKNETIVKTNVSSDELNVAVFVLYYFGPHNPVKIKQLKDGTFDLVAGYYGRNGSQIKREIDNTNGDLIRLYGRH